MIYEEQTKHNGLFAGLSLVLLLILFAPVMLDVKELCSDEGFFLAATQELRHFPPLMKVHGNAYYGGYPLFPILVKLLTDCGLSSIVALRLIPCLSLFVLALVIFLSLWKAKDLTAAMAGTGALLINFVTIEKFMEGNPVLLGTLGIFSAWMLWFALGVWRGNWKLAWILSFLLLGLTFYTIGVNGAILTCIPMLFHRRPLSVWTKPRGMGLIAGVGILFLFILLWGIPRWTAPETTVWRGNELDFPTMGEYLLHLATFPFDAAMRFLPWTFFAWAPFCPALVPLEENPLLSRYLRTLFLGTFVLLWISPFTESKDIFYMIPPLAVLVALNYWIVVRRYGWNLLKVFQLTAMVLLILCTCLFGYLIIPADNLPVFLTENLPRIEGPAFRISALICAASGIFFSLISVIFCMCGTRVWMVILFLSPALILPYRGFIVPYQNITKKRVEFAMGFRKSLLASLLPEERLEKVYHMHDIPPLYNELHYFGIDIKDIAAPSDFPKNETVVYVFSRVVPSAPERTWERLHAVHYKEMTIELWRGKLKTEEDYE